MLVVAAGAATQAAPLEQAALAAAATAAPTQQLQMVLLTLAVAVVAVDTLAARLAWQAETAAPVS
jgi:hypothetical protein